MEELNEGHYHELVDRLHVVMCTIEDHMVDHPASAAHEDIQQLIVEAQVKLAEAYQLTGKLMKV